MLWLLLVSFYTAQPDAPVPDTLARIKQTALDNLRRLPNYTCTETIERSSRPTSAADSLSADRVRLEVGYIDGKELFGWPGGGRLDEQDLKNLIGGTASNGDYALVTRAVFGKPNVALGELKPETRNGRAALRCDFSSPREGSSWVLTFDYRSAPTAFHGSFWVDRDSLQLLEVEMAADNVPAYSGFDTISRTLQFGVVRIGAGDFLLPARGEIRAGKTAGREVRYATEFAGCRQYAAESVLSFGPSESVPQPAAPTRPGTPAGVLPRKFLVSLALDSLIDSETSAVGDPFTAHLLEDIKNGGRVAIPKGAILHGRISRLDLGAEWRYADLAFLYFESDGNRIELEDRTNVLFVSVTRPWDPWSGSNRAPILRPGPLRVPGNRIVLRPGFRFLVQSETR